MGKSALPPSAKTQTEASPVCDEIRDLLEKSQVLAEDSNMTGLAYIIAMALEELNEVEGLGGHYALLLREASVQQSGN